MSEHVWAQENIAAYVAGGLCPAEGERLEAHLGDCTACAHAVEEARSLDRKLAPLFAAANPGPALEDRVIQALPMHGFVRRAPLSGKQKAMLAAAAIVLLAASGAGISMLMERGSLSTPTLALRSGAFQPLPPVYGGAQTPRKEVFAPTEGAEVSAKTSDKAAESPPSADQLAKELRDATVSDFQDGDPPAKRSDHKFGLAYHPEFLSSSARQDKEVSELWQELNKGTKSTATSSGPAGAFTGQPTSPPMVAGGAGYGAIGAPTMGPRPTINMPGKAGVEAGDRPRELVWKYSSGSNLPPLAQFFFKPGDDREDKAEAKVADHDDSKGTKSLPLAPPSIPIVTSAKTETAIAQKTDQAPQPEPQPAPRKIIIRTGDLEFEIDSFDASVAVIMKLVTAAKGAFVGTINSDKLPNGKVRGSIVVRVPPDLLDTFVLDLRKELAKSGELKNQHIGSLDITKQFTDLESRLRAARTMEERLLAIIKDGKGQIKDLLMAEKELGVWRTQIESLEGELRYYSNQASLSTLTIKLYEKDIRTAASVTESERVQAGLEVDDVEKAHREALKAILEAKGRVTRSELKQHAAGQFNAVLHFEVAPDAAGPLRDRLKQLGTMVRLQVDRVQQTEGGGTAPKDGKIERGPTQFLLSLYNLANIAPRETIILRIAAADVPAIYQKLREVVAKAKGHVINAQLDEKDRQNINAQLDFHVSRMSEGEVLAALPSAGETLSRQVNRIPESDNVTDSKVLFRIALLDADSIQPRETVTVKIAAADVPTAYQKLREAIAKAKARVLTAQLNEQDRRNVTAQLDFTLRRADEAALQLVLGGAGETLSRQANRLPENPTLTDSKLLFQVTLLDVESIPPRETVTVKIAATDVPAAYQRLRDIVAQVKGRILSAQINEQDRRNITAQFDFTVRRSDEKALEAALAGAGESLSRLVARAPENGNVTDAKVLARVELIPAAAIPPREITTLAMEVPDVAAALTLLSAQVKEAHGRTVETQVGQERNGQVSARVVFDVPLNVANALVEKFKTAGQVRVHQVTREPQAPEGKLALGRLVLTLSNTPLLVPSDQGLWSQVRSGLAFSLRGLSVSASWLIVGLLFVLPWVLVLYAVIWLARRLWRVEGAPVSSVTNPPS